MGILDTDRQADVALLAVGQDHNAYLRPSALLVHVGIDIRIDVLRDRIQQAAQKGIAVNVVHGNRDGQILFLLAFHIFALEVVERIASKFIAIPVPGGAVVPFVLYHALRITAAVLGCLAFSEILNRLKKRLRRKTG